MDASKSLLYVFYIESKSCFFYGFNFQSMLKVDFPSDIVSDLEVLSREKLSIFIQTFLESNGFNPGNVAIILAPNITFERDFSKTTLSVEVEKQIQSFLDLVPFENVLSQSYKLGEKTRVVAVNKEFCDVIKTSFEKQKFFVTAVSPVSILQSIIPELANSLNLQIILQKGDVVKQYSIYKTEDTKTKNISENKNYSKKSQNLFMLLGIFGFLILILIVVMLKSGAIRI